jgi:hypothetical protein
LFFEVSLGYGPPSLKVLEEWIDSRDPERIEAVSSQLSVAPADFVFQHADFVSNALRKAHAVGKECYHTVSGNLHTSAQSGGRHRIGGGPFPEDVALRDRAKTAAERYWRGSPEHEFYDTLVHRAAGNIRRTHAEDEEIEDA